VTDLQIVGVRLLGGGRLVFRAGQDAAAKRGHFDGLVAEADVREAEAAADYPAVSEQLLDLIRMRVGADVEVLRLTSEEKIAHAATDEVGGIVELLQAVKNLEGVRIDVPA
jgi:hypothetical protein